MEWLSSKDTERRRGKQLGSRVVEHWSGGVPELPSIRETKPRIGQAPEMLSGWKAERGRGSEPQPLSTDRLAVRGWKRMSS